MHLYGSIQKIDAEQRMVFGYASTEAVDGHGETVLKSAIEAALDDYLEFANIREMHQLSAVGTTEEASVDDKGLYIGARIVDDTAWGKVTNGVYKGFSIGGKVLGRDAKDKTVITQVRLDEISLVDRPSNPEARFDIWKAAGAPSDPLAKVTAERDDLVVQLRQRDAEIAALTGRIERIQPRVDSMAKELAELRKSSHDTRSEPVTARQANNVINGIEERTAAVHEALADLGARLQHLERGCRHDA